MGMVEGGSETWWRLADYLLPSRVIWSELHLISHPLFIAQQSVHCNLDKSAVSQNYTFVLMHARD